MYLVYLLVIFIHWIVIQCMLAELSGHFAMGAQLNKSGLFLPRLIKGDNRALIGCWAGSEYGSNLLDLSWYGPDGAIKGIWMPLMSLEKNFQQAFNAKSSDHRTWLAHIWCTSHHPNLIILPLRKLLRVRSDETDTKLGIFDKNDNQALGGCWPHVEWALLKGLEDFIVV